MLNYEIRVLRQEEKVLTRALYEEAFPEDTPPLVDFYYRYRMSENRVYAALRTKDAEPAGGEEARAAGDTGPSAGSSGSETPVTEAGRRLLPSDVIGMTCLNPYRVLYGGRECRISYLSAVATAKAHRREGIMRKYLTAILRDECRRGAPFTFLEPADPAYYLPFGFAYAADVRHLALRRDAEAERVVLRQEEAGAFSYVHAETGSPEKGAAGGGSGGNAADAAQRQLRGELLKFLNRYLSERYAVFAVRDEHYLTNLLAELSAGGGRAEVFLSPAGDGSGQRTLSGVCFRDFADEPDEDARFFAEERIAAETKENSPFAMVRITNLPEFLRPVRLHASCPGSRTRLFRFRDPQIPYNDGIWRWTLSGNGSSLRKLPDRESCTAKELESTGSLPDMTPGALAQWAFSYAASPADVPWLKEAEPAGAAYFDEET